LGRQLAFELLLHRKQRRRQRHTSAGVVSGGGLRQRRTGEAHERRWRDTGQAKLRSGGGGARAVVAAAGLATTARVGSKARVCE
jgi:hypothetical protein